MGKGGKGKKGSKCFQGKESFQRMNFLYQAANVVLAQPKISGDLPAYYGHSLLSVAQKSVLKIEPDVKRDLCKGCGCLLKPGVTMLTRVRSRILICTCLYCGTIKRFPCNKEYKLWIENREACLEVIEVPECTNAVSDETNKKTPGDVSHKDVKFEETLQTMDGKHPGTPKVN